jgi:hypothetical protein
MIMALREHSVAPPTWTDGADEPVIEQLDALAESARVQAPAMPERDPNPRADESRDRSQART